MLNKRTRRKHCLACAVLFEPDPRTKGNQKYCSKPNCQTIRQRKNEKNWRKRNPECLEQQRQQTRKWFKTHPKYSFQRRQKNPRVAKSNHMNTRVRMKKIRQIRLFDKSKVILTQLSGNKEVRCYLTRGNQWLYMRLTKASPLSRLPVIRHNKNRIINNLSKTKWLYEISDKNGCKPVKVP